MESKDRVRKKSPISSDRLARGGQSCAGWLKGTPRLKGRVDDAARGGKLGLVLEGV